MSRALEHCGYDVAADKPGGKFAISLSTPFEGASVMAEMKPAGESGRDWKFAVAVENNRGLGYSAGGMFCDCGRSVAKKMLRSMALELRSAYCHRGRKIQRRAQARAAAKAAQEGGGKA